MAWRHRASCRLPTGRAPVPITEEGIAYISRDTLAMLLPEGEVGSPAFYNLRIGIQLSDESAFPAFMTAADEILDRPGVELLATRDEGYSDGRLWFDGREQWGDLLFETSAQRATSFARLEHALRDKPRWLRSRVTLAALFLAYNACLAVVFWTLLTAPLTTADAERARFYDACVTTFDAAR